MSDSDLASRPSVLIVDDDYDLLRQLGAAFLAAGFDTSVAPDGEVALKMFQDRLPDVVVTDLIMPTREGIETIMALRASQHPTRIIAISGGYRVGPGEFLNMAKMLGADAVLPKPFRPSRLVDLARELLEREDAVAAP